MNTQIIIFTLIFFISLVMALRAVRHELTVPESVKKIRIRRKKGFSGAILFLKEKIVHYSSGSS
ncbi:MAG: hypothetical protein UV73_C0009G0025 [Candidatus Gottesmanbacteria bacterium GW2011_GWA2_43_14]|uniref:Uncharacterized protein n=1 Tax=Candidatus Gottesmanbacteria bacterium GW2011_GWA2_43_14 TaxID=1618443 RepID=A0A0G1DG89_9BACT|nr:MAG: hypothetical protein UV73_C0009G0025 [Candidatus Gottesmanbacteria bacterium GW2011_GWA2_43_14]